MKADEDKLISIMNRDRADISTSVLQSIYKQHGEMDYNSDISRHQKSQRDLMYHLDYLAGALAAGSPRLFTDYQLWCDRLFINLGLPEKMMQHTSLELAKELKDRAPEEIHSTIDSYFLQAWPKDPTKASSSLILQADKSLNELASKYLSLLRQFKRDEAIRLILEAVEAGENIPHIYLEVFQPVQYQIGKLWHSNQISVAEEHYFTAVTQLALSQLYPSIFAKVKPGGKRMIGASVEGELHELGIKIVTDLMALDGWDTHYLGANTPEASLLDTINQIQPDVVCISASTAFSLPRVRSLLEKIRGSAQPMKVPILVGGIPFISDPDLWKRVGADGFAANGTQAVLTANRLSQEVR